MKDMPLDVKIVSIILLIMVFILGVISTLKVSGIIQ